jgi:hypothetical protein
LTFEFTPLSGPIEMRTWGELDKTFVAARSVIHQSSRLHSPLGPEGEAPNTTLPRPSMVAFKRLNSAVIWYLDRSSLNSIETRQGSDKTPKGQHVLTCSATFSFQGSETLLAAVRPAA